VPPAHEKETNPVYLKLFNIKINIIGFFD